MRGVWSYLLLWQARHDHDVATRVRAERRQGRQHILGQRRVGVTLVKEPCPRGGERASPVEKKRPPRRALELFDGLSRVQRLEARSHADEAELGEPKAYAHKVLLALGGGGLELGDEAVGESLERARHDGGEVLCSACVPFVGGHAESSVEHLRRRGERWR